MEPKIKLLICYHKKDVLLQDDILTPIHVGRALARKRVGEDDPQYRWLAENMIGDDTGGNISEKNASYNELTAVYWAWKNYKVLGDPDYIGLMHYRRHFIFRDSYDVVENVRGIDENYFDRINYSRETMAHLFDDCDYVAHIGHVDQVYKHYTENHHIEDLELAVKILKEKYPDYAATADAYLKMSYVNLCNMFIMPREMFFAYCAWLFDILEEFEKQVDLSDKRLFISERLTGIFIEQQKRNGKRQKALSATFVQADMRVPVAMPYQEDVFRTAVTVASIIKQTEPTTHVDFAILHSGEAREKELKEFLRRYPAHTLTFIDVPKALREKGIAAEKFRFPEQYPLAAAEVLDKVNKLLYIDERAFFFGDAGKFFLACNNDEYAVLGLPQDVNAEEKVLRGNAFSLNAARLRRLKIAQKAAEIKEKDAAAAFARLLPGQVNYFPWWVYNITDEKKDGTIYYDRHRGDQRWAVWEHAMLYYDAGMEPWKNLQGLYSVYWWEVAAELPSCIPFAGLADGAEELWYDQSADLCKARGSRKKQPAPSPPMPSAVPEAPPVEQYSQELPAPTPERKKGVFARTIAYWKQHGLRQTLKKIFGKLKRK